MWRLKNKQSAMFGILAVLVSIVSFSSSAVQQTKVNIRTIRQTAEGSSSSSSSSSSASCVCVPYYYCNSDNIVITNGVGLINIRQARQNTETDSTCEEYLEVCCRLPEPTNDSPKCGYRQESKLLPYIPRLDKEEADPGEFPWMVTIFRTKTVQNNNETKTTKVYQCQGSLISDRVVLTSAQCVVTQRSRSGNSSEPLSIRAGQLDTMMTNEEAAYQEHAVKKVIIHRKYNATKLQNNIALLVLHTPVIINKYVDITCLADRSDIIDEQNCLTIGWDKYLAPEDAKTQRSQVNILKKRSVPYVKTAACERQLRNTPLGKRFRLDNCSICAGGSPGKNTCSNEIGGPLACPLKSEPTRYVQVGVTSWCIRSGNLQTPSVFANVVHLRGWIDRQMVKQRFDTSVYRVARQ